MCIGYDNIIQTTYTTIQKLVRLFNVKKISYAYQGYIDLLKTLKYYYN